MKQDSDAAERDSGEDATLVTERSLERCHEDEAFVPVILKRMDEFKRHPDDVLERAIRDGVEQFQRPWLSLGLSAVTAGLVLGFTAMSVGVTTTALLAVDLPFLQRLATALVYPLGFVICIMSGTELFTEHTATAVYPVLDKKASWNALTRLWGVIIVGNLIGTTLSAFLLVMAEDVIGAREGYLAVAHHLVEFDASALLVSAMLAGWLMAQGGWLVLATPPTGSQVTMIYIVTFLIGLAGFHHSIAGSAEMMVAFLVADQFSFVQVVRFVGLALLGNAIGGSLFVAGLNYGHIRRTQVAQQTSEP